jgi:hypothetical protein
VTYAIQFAVDLDAVSDDVRAEIHRTMAQIAEAVTTLPEASPFFASMGDSVLQIDVKGFRLVYAVDPARREVRVIELQRIRA